METLKVLAFSGSLQKDSLNKKALKVAVKIAREYGMEVKEADLAEINLPVYNQDVENPFPNSVKSFRDMAAWADVFIISSPEHNHSLSAGLKNAIDWLSRKYDETLRGKAAVILGVSVGNSGTLRSQAHLRQILEALDIFIVSQPEVFITNGLQKFDAEGNLTDEKSFTTLEALIKKTFDQYIKIK
jgi:chromate reductase